MWKSLNARQKRILINSNSSESERINFPGFILLLLLIGEKETLREDRFPVFWSVAVDHAGRRPGREQTRKMRDVLIFGCASAAQSVKWMGNNSVTNNCPGSVLCVVLPLTRNSLNGERVKCLFQGTTSATRRAEAQPRGSV